MPEFETTVTLPVHEQNVPSRERESVGGGCLPIRVPLPPIDVRLRQAQVAQKRAAGLLVPGDVERLVRRVVKEGEEFSLPVVHRASIDAAGFTMGSEGAGPRVAAGAAAVKGTFLPSPIGFATRFNAALFIASILRPLAAENKEMDVCGRSAAGQSL
jgi:hypothetical protein